MSESKLKSSVILRMSIIAALTLLLLIPTFYVEPLISERSSRRNEATQGVSQRWGGMQTLTGPILTIPFKEYSKNEKGVVQFAIRHAHFLPASLHIRSELKPEVRYRGIYEVALYNAQLVIDGQFMSPAWEALRINTENVLWNDAFITLGISDLKGIRDTVNLQWNNVACPSNPGVLSDDVVASGITFRPNLDKAKPWNSFSIPLNLNGSSEVRFVPVGELTDVILESPWGNPSFVGSFLPHVREIKPDSFHSEWKVFNLNRNFPQAWVGQRYNVAESSFGASLFLPVDEYQKASRSVKYALLFIALTFVAFFLSELIAKTSFHPIQYTLIGFALILFYLLLLSLSEHMGFNLAYFIASIGTISLVTVYAFWISAKRQVSAVIFLVLSALYGFLFVTLQLQDYALLLGSVGLFVVLFLIMYLTRTVDWFSVNPAEN
jgi:inner membrane protein